MTNNLKVLKEDLKAFAKKVKGFKYTDSALITFLLTGAISLNGVSAETSIKAQAEALNTSMTNLKDKIKVARRESEKSLKGENMELIQLMEQGDHVVKSPWSSWQYGINGFYNNWRGTYKGRGNKTADVKYKRNNSLEKFKYDSRTHTLYGNTTELGLEREPNAMIPVSASVTPIIPRIKHADISMAVDISDLPSFNPRTVSAPSSPTISPVGTINAPSFSLLAMSAGNYGEDYYDNANATGGGVIDGGVIIKSGNFLAKRTQNDTDGTRGFYDYSYNNYNVKNVFNLNAHLTPPPAVPLPMTSDNPDPLVQPLYRGDGITLNRNLTKTKAKTGFLRMVTDNGWGGSGHEQGGTLVNNGGKFLYTKAFNDPKGYVNEFVHLDMHGGANFTDQKSRLSGELGTTSPEYLAFDDVTAIANKISKSTQGQTFINSGTFVIEGGNVAFSNSYDHAEGDASTVAASVINTSKGNITVHPYTGSEGTYDSNSAVFIVSPSVVGNGNPQILYNAGTVNLYNKKSAVFFLNPNGDFTRNHRNKSDYGGPFDAKLYWSGGYPVPAGHLYDDDEKNPREITIVNRNKINSYGEENVGIYIKTGKYVSSANLDFKTKSSNGDWAPMTMYGDKSIGLYVPIDKT